MPSPYVVRAFENHHFYHVFNRGYDKNKIFKSNADFRIFNYYLFVYLNDPKIVAGKYPNLTIKLKSRNLFNQLNLISYCLMPNHFHLLIRQNLDNAISQFMQRLSNAYTKYFNAQYNHEGNLFQGRFKAVHVSSNELLLHVGHIFFAVTLLTLYFFYFITVVFSVLVNFMTTSN